MLRKIIFFFVCSFHLSYAAPVPVPPPPKPNDRWLILIAHDGRYLCVSKNSSNQATVYNGYHWENNCVWVRYDMFSRFSIRTNGQELCLTIPDSVVNESVKWDYLEFKTCAVGDFKQVWKLNRDNPHNVYIYNPYKGWRILDYEWTLYVSNSGHSWYKHRVATERSDVKILLDTDSRPDTYVIPLHLHWHYNSESYSLFSEKIFYNPSNFNIINESGQCLTSNLGISDKVDWKYTSFDTCPTELTDQEHWYILLSPTTNNYAKYRIFDGNSNELVVARSGSGWGEPFVGSPKYIASADSDKINFEFESSDLYKDGIRQINANLANVADECNLTVNIKNRMFPTRPDLMDDEWIERLWNIARSAQAGTLPRVGYCGVCVLHTMEMLSEANSAFANHQTTPPEQPSYMLLTPDADPFIYFRDQHRLLAERLTEFQRNANAQIGSGFTSTAEEHAFYELSELQTLTTFMPQISTHRTLSVRFPIVDFSFFDNMMAQAAGTTWFVSYTYRRTDGSTGGHSTPIYRSGNGVHIIPVNLPGVPLEDYREYTRRFYTDPRDFLSSLLTGFGAGSTIRGLIITRVDGRIPDGQYSQQVSFSNCEGAGPSRRGNGGNSNAAMLNRCSPTGRCAIQ